jgi:hypothetical protein
MDDLDATQTYTEILTGKFVSARLVRVLIEEEMGGVTQHIDSKETLERYYQEDTQFSC